MPNFAIFDHIKTIIRYFILALAALLFVLGELWVMSLIWHTTWVWWWRVGLLAYVLLLSLVALWYLFRAAPKGVESVILLYFFGGYFILMQYFMYGGLQKRIAWEKLDQYGVFTKAVITRCDSYPESSRLWYEWQVDGKHFLGTSGGGGRKKAGCIIGKEIDISYLPDQPRESRREDVTYLGTSFWPCFAVTCLYLYYFYRELKD